MAEEVTLAPPPAAREEASPGSWREAFPTRGAWVLFLVALACQATLLLASGALAAYPELVASAPWTSLVVLGVVASTSVWLMVLERARRVGEHGWELAVALVLTGPLAQLAAGAIERPYDGTLFALRQTLEIVTFVAPLFAVVATLRLALRARDVRPSSRLVVALWSYPLATLLLLLAPSLVHRFLAPPVEASVPFFGVAWRVAAALQFSLLIALLVWVHFAMMRPRASLMRAAVVLSLAHVVALALLAFGRWQSGDAFSAPSSWQRALERVLTPSASISVLLAALALTLSPRRPPQSP